MKKLTTILIDKGCKRIGYLLGSSASNHNRLHFEGFKEVLKENSIPLIEEIIYDANSFTEASGYEVKKETLEKINVSFDALICENDELAIGAIKALKEKGIKVPEDVKVTGFDNIEKCELITPKLTTISPNWYHFGEEMCKYKLKVLTGKASTHTLLLNADKIERESTK